MPHALLQAITALTAAIRELAERTHAPKRAAQPKQKAAPKPRPKPAPQKWTPERKALAGPLIESMTPWQEVLDAVNALPGPPIASVDGLMKAAQYNGWHRPRTPSPWTPERLERAERGYRTGEAVLDIFAAVSTMGGSPLVSVRSVHDQATARGWKRDQCADKRAREPKNADAGTTAHTRAPKPTTPPPPAVPHTTPPSRPKPTPAPPPPPEEIAAWIARNGVTRLPAAAVMPTTAVMPADGREVIRAHDTAMSEALTKAYQERWKRGAVVGKREGGGG